MAYLDNLFGPAAGRYERSLNGAAERQAHLLRNLANVNTPGYKREDSDFTISLDEEMGSSKSEFNKRRLANIRGDNSSIRQDGNNVDLEFEVMAISTTETRYNTLTELTSRYFSGLKNVIREGH